MGINRIYSIAVLTNWLSYFYLWGKVVFRNQVK